MYACVLLVSAATLLLEIALTRIFAVTQGYHFAFLAISLALLGFGASGTALAIVPALASRDVRPLIAGAGLLFAVTSVGGLYLVKLLPFDAYTLLWEPSQLAYLAVYYMALAVPFFFAGTIVGAALAKHPTRAGGLYGVNLVGAGIGCLLSVVFPLVVGAAGSVVVAGVIALIGAAAITGRDLRRPAWLIPAVLAVAVLVAAVALGVLELRLSPYKAVSQALRHENASKAWSEWNAFSLVEVIESDSIHAAPGLSFAYQGGLPRQAALAVDGDNLSPMTAAPPEQAEFAEYLPTSLVYRLTEHPSALVIEPGGGLDVLTALRNGAESVTAVISNPLVVEAVGEKFGHHASGILKSPEVTVVDVGTRSYLHRTDKRFDVIQLSLADSFRPVLAGAYGVSENYLYTAEAFESYYSRLAPYGFLSVTRWAQTPPSEGVRVVSVAIEALEKLGVEPGDHIAVIRSLQTITLIVKRSPLDDADIALVRRFADDLQYDLVYHPGIRAADVNRFSVHPTPAYYDTVQAMLNAGTRGEFHAGYSHDISPVSDDRPFYFHLFRWSQIPEILRNLGRTFQPFGGRRFPDCARQPFGGRVCGRCVHPSAASIPPGHIRRHFKRGTCGRAAVALRVLRRPRPWIPVGGTSAAPEVHPLPGPAHIRLRDRVVRRSGVVRSREPCVRPDSSFHVHGGPGRSGPFGGVRLWVATALRCHTGVAVRRQTRPQCRVACPARRGDGRAVPARHPHVG